MKTSMDQPARINLFKGHPSFRLLPNDEIIDATRELLAPAAREYDEDTNNRHPLTYGADEGAVWVRQNVCDFNNGVFGLSGDTASRPEFLNLNSGASYGILSTLLHSTLAHTGYTRQAFIITPTYFLINDCFIDAGFGSKLTAIDEKGQDSIDLDQLVAKLEYFESNTEGLADDTQVIQNPTKPVNKKVYRYVMYCVPTFSNPSGKTYSLETRTKLIEIARKYDMLIIADDVYDLLDYRTEDVTKLPKPVKRFVHIDRDTNRDPNSYGNTISNATFSKIIAPGLRVGYHETINEKLALQLSKGGANISGGTPSQLNSMIVGTILKNGSMEKILYRLRKTYKERSEVIKRTLAQLLPAGTDISAPDGGYFVWVTLPEGYDSREIGETLKRDHGVVLANGSGSEVVGDPRNWGARCARLSISFLEKEEIEEGCKLWAQVCVEYAKTHNLSH
ncbi:hypothetical protein RNJ44_03384 [Nakaseomyces bracarensis]|uniref:Aminotransferase class I/classII large domain-containing protein n=1 Tax=Nakaseomyces bracarensis TaxID=273131 RepID=A0ABR4NZM4_9SACH